MFGQGKHLAHQKEHGRSELRLRGERGQLREVALHHALVRQRAGGNHGGGRMGIASQRYQLRHHFRQAREAHVKDQGALKREFRKTQRCLLTFGPAGVGRDKRHAGAQPAMRHRDAKVRGCGDAGSDARDDLEGNACLCQCQGLFAAAAENEGVPALETHDPLVRLCLLEDDAGNIRLRQAVSARLLPREDLFSARGMAENLGIDECVVDHHIREGQALYAAHRDEAGLTRPRTHKIDFSSGRHPYRVLALAKRMKWE